MDLFFLIKVLASLGGSWSLIKPRNKKNQKEARPPPQYLSP
jgi:hypothetical protein